MKGELIVSHCGGHVEHDTDSNEEVSNEEINAMIGVTPKPEQEADDNEHEIAAMLSFLPRQGKNSKSQNTDQA